LEAGSVAASLAQNPDTFGHFLGQGQILLSDVTINMPLELPVVPGSVGA
jgi:hypothetical protein